MESPQQIARMQFVYGDHDEELRALLDESLAPRPPDFLFDLAVPLLTPDSRLLDVGCRDARHLIPLVARSGCTGVGIDPIDRNLDRARAAVTTADLDQRIEIRRGVMEISRGPTATLMWSGAATCLRSFPTYRRASRKLHEC
jgi:SAM-dependent methyltransferase